jgi:hypothetical protein
MNDGCIHPLEHNAVNARAVSIYKSGNSAHLLFLIGTVAVFVVVTAAQLIVNLTSASGT